MKSNEIYLLKFLNPSLKIITIPIYQLVVKLVVLSLFFKMNDLMIESQVGKGRWKFSQGSQPDCKLVSRYTSANLGILRGVKIVLLKVRYGPIQNGPGIVRPGYG